MNDDTIREIQAIGRKAREQKMQNAMEYMISTHQENGGHFFDEDTMAFFDSKIESDLREGVFFVTSERFPSGGRRYTIRRFSKDALDVTTVGEFGAYGSRKAAMHALEAAAEGRATATQ
jgi:hypothetical protein